MAEGTSPGSGQPGWNPPQHQPPSTPQPPQYSQPGQPPQHPTQQPQQPGQPPHYPSQQPGQPQQPAPQHQQHPQQQQAFWARGATSDPWRNPQTSAVVTQTPQAAMPPTEPPLPPPPRRAGQAGLGSMMAVATVVALIAGFMGAAIALLASPDDSTGQFGNSGGRELGDYEEMLEAVQPGVVTIWVESAEGSGNGSGWVMSSEGYIVTNAHVADMAESSGAEMTVQFHDGTITEADVVGAATSTDIAVLQVNPEDAGGELQALDIADSEGLAVGHPVVAVGAPFGLAGTVTDGIVSALDRPVVAGESEADATVMAGIQTDASINPGNSGGPLLNESGEVIGVNTSIYAIANERGEGGSIGLGFAIPSNQASRVAEDLVDDGTAQKPVLGADLEETKMGDSGAEVDKVDSDTPAAEAGIEDGDVITGFNGVTVTDDIQLQALVLKHSPEEKVTVAYERDGSETETDVQLAGAEDE